MNVGVEEKLGEESIDELINECGGLCDGVKQCYALASCFNSKDLKSYLIADERKFLTIVCYSCNPHSPIASA